MNQAPTILRGVLFDLDGTLLNSLADIAASANAVLQSFGFPPHPVDAYRYFVGNGVAILIQRVLPPDRRDDAEVHARCVEAFRVHYRDNWNVLSRLYDGVPDMLHAIADRGLNMGVFSNKPHEFTRLCVEHYLSEFHFRAVLGLNEERPRKPDPSGAWEVAHLLEVKPQECLYLGDTSVDMETARRAGMYPVGALWGFRDARELRDAGAQVLIHHPLELIPILEAASGPARAS